MEMLPFLLKEIAPIRIFGQELFTFVFLYRLLITYPLKTFRYRMPRKPLSPPVYRHKPTARRPFRLPVLNRSGSQHIIRTFDHIHIMLDNYHGVTFLDQGIESFQQSLDIMKM